MKTWLRLTLVLFTVGGGFTLLGGLTQSFAQVRQVGLAATVLWVAMLACAFFVIASGLTLVVSPERLLPVQVALAMQIPYVTWPYFMYSFASGAAFYLLLSLGSFNGYNRISEHSAWWFFFGSAFSIGGAEHRHWTMGVNFIALILCILIRHAVKTNTSRIGADSPMLSFGKSPLKNWLRLLLIVVLAGGGFGSIVLAVDNFSELSRKGPLGLFIFAAMIILPAIEVAVGLLLTYSPQQTSLLRAALGLQIPWITSPLISFRFMCGAGVWIVLSSGPLDDAGRLLSETIRWRGQYGAFESIGVGGHSPWSLGVNLVPVVLFFLLPPIVRSRRSAQRAEPTFWDTVPRPPAS